MELVNELLAKLPRVFSKNTLEQDANLGTLQWFGKAKALRLDRYYELWREKIRNAANHNQLLSNGWAFSTLGGLAAFENYIHTNQDIRRIYFDKAGEISVTLEKIAEHLNWGQIGGVILYGYGNLFRENYFLEQAKNLNLLKSQRTYLVDCSIFYHILANSPLNPLRNTIKIKQIKTILLDYLDDTSALNDLTFARNDLNPMRPVLHLFLGNTFGNIETNLLTTTLNNVVRVGDFVIGEYALYPDEFFTDTSDDNVTDMARAAISEVFSISPDTVTVCNVNITPQSKVIEINFTEQNAVQSTSFRSMLRRSFSKSELTNGEYRLISSTVALNGAIGLDAYRRLQNIAQPNA